MACLLLGMGVAYLSVERNLKPHVPRGWVLASVRRDLLPRVSLRALHLGESFILIRQENKKRGVEACRFMKGEARLQSFESQVVLAFRQGDFVFYDQWSRRKKVALKFLPKQDSYRFSVCRQRPKVIYGAY